MTCKIIRKWNDGVFASPSIHLKSLIRKLEEITRSPTVGRIECEALGPMSRSLKIKQTVKAPEAANQCDVKTQ